MRLDLTVADPHLLQSKRASGQIDVGRRKFGAEESGGFLRSNAPGGNGGRLRTAVGRCKPAFRSMGPFVSDVNRVESTVSDFEWPQDRLSWPYRRCASPKATRHCQSEIGFSDWDHLPGSSRGRPQRSLY
jgi:hypothetical protein